MRREVALQVQARSALPDPAGTEDSVVYRCLKAVNDLLAKGLYVDLNPTNPREKEGVALAGRQFMTFAKQGATGDIDITREENYQETNIDKSLNIDFGDRSWDIDFTEDNSIMIVLNGVVTNNTTTEIEIVTDVRYDATTKQVQKKTLTCRVIDVAGESESAWTMVEGGQAVEETT